MQHGACGGRSRRDGTPPRRPLTSPLTYSRSASASPSVSSRRCFTTSPMLIMPHSRPSFSTTGTCLMRRSVISAMIALTRSSGEQVNTFAVITLPTLSPSTSVPWSAMASRMSRSDRMPTRSAPVSETMSAPIRSARRRWSASPSETSGLTVFTSRPLRARMYSTFIGRSSRCCALTLRLDPGPLLELAYGVAHALEHGLLAAGHVLALGCRQAQRIVTPALQDRVLLVGGEVLMGQDLLRLTEHGTRIVQRSL